MSGWLEYASNNSGGSFWLSDEDWKNLAEAGWTVGWIYAVKDKYTRFGSDEVTVESGRLYGDTWEEATRTLVPGERQWPDSDRDTSTILEVAGSFEEAVALRSRRGGYFGALAVSAVKRGESAAELVAEFERVTGQDASAEGCNCCGPPHHWEWHDDDGTTSRGSATVTETQLVWSS